MISGPGAALRLVSPRRHADRFSCSGQKGYRPDRKQLAGPFVSLNIVIGIATAGRPSILPETLRDIERQTRAPERIIVCAPAEADFGMAREQAGASTSFLIGPRGLTRQRNAIITAAGDADAVLFLDDDFLMAPDYVSMIDKAMSDDPSIVVATGLVLADGIKEIGRAHV